MSSTTSSSVFRERPVYDHKSGLCLAGGIFLMLLIVCFRDPAPKVWLIIYFMMRSFLLILSPRFCFPRCLESFDVEPKSLTIICSEGSKGYPSSCLGQLLQGAAKCK